jgi:hypothetical protein
MRSKIAHILIVAVLAGPTTLAAQRVDPKPKDLEPCCAVTAISVADGMVTAREIATGYTFKFKVDDKKLLTTIKVGEKVWADLAAKKVRLKKADAEPCCGIIVVPKTGRGGAP